MVASVGVLGQNDRDQFLELNPRSGRSVLVHLGDSIACSYKLVKATSFLQDELQRAFDLARGNPEERVSVTTVLRALECDPQFSLEHGNCVANVTSLQKTHGGEVVFGWRVYVNNHMLELEAHAVWKLHGRFLDVTQIFTSEGYALDSPGCAFVEDRSDIAFTRRSARGKAVNLLYWLSRDIFVKTK